MRTGIMDNNQAFRILATAPRVVEALGPLRLPIKEEADAGSLGLGSANGD